MHEFARYLSRLKSYLRLRGRSNEDAEDLIQEAFLRLEVYSREHKVEQPEAFLVRTVANLSVDKYRHDGFLRLEERPVEDLEILDTAPQPDAVAAARERLTHVIAGLERLSPKTKEIFIALRYEGLGYQELAKRYGTTVSAIEKHHARAMMHMMDWMDGHD
jgi:RNA polymerase sigma factor (sigma-70 family)